MYENALKIELEDLALFVERQKPISVHYNGIIIGEYFADLIVNRKVIVELKAAECLMKEHELQLINYLKQLILRLGFYLILVKNLRLEEKFFLKKIIKSAKIC